jgi:hypothetical protein
MPLRLLWTSFWDKSALPCTYIKLKNSCWFWDSRSIKLCLHPDNCWLLYLLFGLEDGSVTCLRNVGVLLSNHTALQRKNHFLLNNTNLFWLLEFTSYQKYIQLNTLTQTLQYGSEFFFCTFQMFNLMFRFSLSLSLCKASDMSNWLVASGNFPSVTSVGSLHRRISWCLFSWSAIFLAQRISIFLLQ